MTTELDTKILSELHGLRCSLKVLVNRTSEDSKTILESLERLENKGLIFRNHVGRDRELVWKSKSSDKNRRFH